MFIEERHRAILELIAARGSVTTAEIQRKFGVGYDSAKRDLRILEEKGLLRRTHGGAIGVGQPELSRPGRTAGKDESPENTNLSAVAKYAVSLIKENSVIFLPPTVEGIAAARELPSGLRVSVAANSMAVAAELRTKPDVSVIFIGGGMDRSGYCFDGFAVELVKRLRFDMSFLVTDCISFDFGLSVKSSIEIPFWNAVIGSSKRTVGLYESKRIGMEASFSVCPASRLDCLITDIGADRELLAGLTDAGIKAITVDPREKDGE